jgi:exopolysaccharide/PEP-CTERM locus tyrosine autokinase
VGDNERLDEAASHIAAQPISAPGVAENGHAIESARLARAGLIREPDSRASEEFRIVQNRVLRQSFGNANAASSGVQNIVMITSALKGEGKSFVSLNLAGEIARQGDRRVLLLDVDPKPNSLSRILGVATARGLLDLARDVRLDIADIIIPTAAEGLDIAPVGQSDGRSGEVFASRRMGQIIEEIGRRYGDRLIILDAPPCLASSTPHALAPACGQAVLVVAANNTQQSDIEAALDLLQACPHVSLLLNKVAPWMTHSFGAYSYLAAEA